MDRRWAGAAAVVLLAVLALAGSSRIDGPVLVHLGGSHGVHLSDPVVLVAAVVALRALLR